MKHTFKCLAHESHEVGIMKDYSEHRVVKNQ